LGLIRCDSGRTEDRRALQHRYVAHEIALARVSQIVFGSVARLERFEFAAQNNCQSEIALPGLKDEIATLHDTTLSEGLKQRKLMIVQFWKRDAFSIAVEPFVLLVVSHLRNLRVTQHNPNLTHSRLLFILFVILLTGCAEDDPEESADPIRRPGSWGRIVEGPSRAELELNVPMGRVSIVLERQDTVLACGETILLRATAKENVDRCEGYSFSVLYQEALRHVNELADRIRCPEKCEKNPYIVYQKGRCGDGDATVTLTMAVTCRNPSDPIIEGLPIKSDAALR